MSRSFIRILIEYEKSISLSYHYILSVLNCFVLKADIHPQSLLLGFGIADQCCRQEKILQLLASGSIDVEDGLLDLSVLYDLMGPRELVADSTQQPLTPYSRWCFCDDESEKSLIYPARKLYVNEPILDVVGEWSICRENAFHTTGDDMTRILTPISDLYLSENTVKSSKRAMLVPYFGRYLLRLFIWLCATSSMKFYARVI